MSTTSAAPAPLPVVLDTNVVLDLLVFDDLVTRSLADALAAGDVIAWADAETLGELRHVLSRPPFALGPDAVAAVLERYLRFVRIAPEGTGMPLPTLPRCKDRDDQKFLNLAARVHATWLVSKDKLVLSLAGRHDLPFDILTPRKAAARLAH